MTVHSSGFALIGQTIQSGLVRLAAGVGGATHGGSHAHQPVRRPAGRLLAFLVSKRTQESKEHSLRRFYESVATRDPMTPLDGSALYLGYTDPVLALSIDPSEMSANTIAVQFSGPLLVRHLREALDGESALALDDAVMRMHFLHHRGAQLSENAEVRSEIMHCLGFVGLEVATLGMFDVKKNGIEAHVVCGQR